MCKHTSELITYYPEYQIYILTCVHCERINCVVTDPNLCKEIGEDILYEVDDDDYEVYKQVEHESMKNYEL